MSFHSTHLFTVLDGVAALQPLQDVRPVRLVIERCQACIAGADGMTAAEVSKLRQWAQRWQQIPSEVQAFYMETAPLDLTAQSCLLLALNGQTPEDWQAAHLRNLWRSMTGIDPVFDLHPLHLDLHPSTTKESTP